MQHAFGLSDFVALLTQNHICNEIGKVYQPGCQIAIFWEPQLHQMNKICKEKLGIEIFPAARVESYQRTLQKMIDVLSPNFVKGAIRNGSIDDVYQEKYASIEVQTSKELEHHYKIFIREDLDTDDVTKAAEKTMFEQKKEVLSKKLPKMKGLSFEAVQADEPLYRKIKPNLSAKKYIDEVSQEIGVTALRGSKRTAALMKNEIENFDQKIRLSVRPDANSVADKVGIPLIVGSEGTPWHNVLVVGKDSIRLAKYKDCCKKNGDLKSDYEVKCHVVGDCELSYLYETY